LSEASFMSEVERSWFLEVLKEKDSSAPVSRSE